MSNVRILIQRDGTIHADINLPEGEECDKADVRFKAMMKMMGVSIDSTDEDERRIPRAEAVREKTRT